MSFYKFSLNFSEFWLENCLKIVSKSNFSKNYDFLDFGHILPFLDVCLCVRMSRIRKLTIEDIWRLGHTDRQMEIQKLWTSEFNRHTDRYLQPFSSIFSIFGLNFSNYHRFLANSPLFFPNFLIILYFFLFQLRLSVIFSLFSTPF